ncbi:unnamed protein product [Larinioides sclopetarius]|uniref:Mitochondrial import inner membrane translocase subunit n=1 Tax=Larinioides sclopetarius TaxID=280406 RepID=A0AAV2ACI7_9ARAC
MFRRYGFLEVKFYPEDNSESKSETFANKRDGGKLSGAQKEELMDQVKQQVAVLLAQELLQKITDKCFRKCITKPGTSLDNSEQKCLSMCMDRYMDSFSLVSRTYAGRLQRERGQL